MPPGGDDTYGGVGGEKSPLVSILAHDIKAIKEAQRIFDQKLSLLAERNALHKLEGQLEKLAGEKPLFVRKEELMDIKAQVNELALDKDYLNGIRGTLGFVKFIIGLLGSVMALAIGGVFGMHQNDMSIVYDNQKQIAKNGAKIEYITDHQLEELMAFKKEVEETGSPILQATIKDFAALRMELKDAKMEFRTMSNQIMQDFLRIKESQKGTNKTPDF